MFMLLECISLGWEKHPCPKEKRDSNQTILPLPYKKHRHALQIHWWSWFCCWIGLKIFTYKISCMQSEHYLVGPTARQLNAPLLTVSLYRYTHIHIHAHRQMHILRVTCPCSLCNEHQEHWKQQCSMVELSTADYLRIYFFSSVMPYLLFKEVKLMV